MLVVTKQECNIKETNQQLCVDFCVFWKLYNRHGLICRLKVK